MLFSCIGKRIAWIYPVSKVFVCSFCRRYEITQLVVVICSSLLLLTGCICTNKGISLTFIQIKSIYTSVQKKNIIRIWFRWTKGLLISDTPWFIIYSVNLRHMHSKFHYLEISNKIQSFPTVVINFRPAWIHLAINCVSPLFTGEAGQVFFVWKHLTPS